MTRIYLAIALAAAIIAIGWYAHHTVWQDGHAAGVSETEAKHAKAAEAAQAESDRRETASATASVDMLAFLAANLPAIEVTTHDAVERVRTIYRDRPAVCTRPGGVQAELDAARERANAAAGGLRPSTHGNAAPNPRAGVDGRVGAPGHGPL